MIVYFALQNARLGVLYLQSKRPFFLHDSPRRMFLLCARIIKIKSWAVSCAKRRIGCGQRRPTFVCPGLGTARCIQYIFFCRQSKLHSKGPCTASAILVGRKNEIIPAPPPSTFSHLYSAICIIVIILNLPVLFDPWAWRHGYPVLSQLQTNTTVCETLCFEWRMSVRSSCWIAAWKTCVQGKHIGYIM